MSRIIQLSDLNVSGGEALYPVTIGSAVTVIRDGNSVSLQSVVDEIPSASGGGGGGSTQNIVATNATLPADGTGASYISTDGGSTFYTISLPSVFPTGWVIGNINSSGQISGSGSTVASGDKLLIAKSSDGEINKSVAFGSSTATFLRNDGQWAAPPSGGGGSTTLGGLTDVTISGASNGQVLTYSSGAWVNSAVPTELPSLTGNGGKVLAVNSGATGVEWITNSSGGGGSTVSIPVSDITLSGSNQLYITVNGISRHIKLPSLGTINYPSSSIPGGSITGSSTQGGIGETSNQVDIASGDRLVIGDWSARGTTQSGSHYPLKLSSISFSSSGTRFLCENGTWATPSGGGGGGGGSTVSFAEGWWPEYDSIYGNISHGPGTIVGIITIDNISQKIQINGARSFVGDNSSTVSTGPQTFIRDYWGAGVVRTFGHTTGLRDKGTNELAFCGKRIDLSQSQFATNIGKFGYTNLVNVDKSVGYMAVPIFTDYYVLNNTDETLLPNDYTSATGQYKLVDSVPYIILPSDIMIDNGLGGFTTLGSALGCEGAAVPEGQEAEPAEPKE